MIEEDIYKIDHYEPRLHSRMSMENRAAQFAPFAALTGFYDEVKEEEKVKYKKKLLSDDDRNIIENKLNLIENNIDKEIAIKYYLDEDIKIKKGYVKRIDKTMKNIIFKDRTTIQINTIVDIKIF